jgi:hypothetical protein
MPACGTMSMHLTESSGNSQSASLSCLWGSTNPSTIQAVRPVQPHSHFYRSTTLLLCLPVDCGDYVVVTNSRKVKVTGRKAEQLLYRKHTMYPGALKETPYKVVMDRNPDHVGLPSPHIILTSPANDNFVCRSSGMQYPACYPRTNSGTVD